jgi:hypothetical protein
MEADSQTHRPTRYDLHAPGGFSDGRWLLLAPSPKSSDLQRRHSDGDSERNVLGRGSERACLRWGVLSLLRPRVGAREASTR